MSPGATLRALPRRVARGVVSLAPPGARVPVLGGPLRGATWIIEAGVNAYWLGAYEREKAWRFVRSVRPGDVVFDVGANVGYYTLLASRAVGPTGLVCAFEPVPRNLAFLRRHLALNRADNVRVVPAALSDVEGEMSFDPGPNPLAGALGEGGALRVPVTSLDAFLARAETPPPRVVKLDVEGEELRALEGARDLLSTVGPTAFVATHSPELHCACADLLRGLGYSIVDDHQIASGGFGELMARRA